MIEMTVRDLIEILEDLDPTLPVVVDSAEAEIAVVRDEMYFVAGSGYQDGPIVKIC